MNALRFDDGARRALEALGPIGKEAADRLVRQTEIIRQLTDNLEASERRVRDQARTIEQLNREIAQLRTQGKSGDT